MWGGGGGGGGLLVVVWGGVWGVRGGGGAAPGGPRPPPRRLEAVERLALGPQHGIYLVRVGGRGMVVGVSPQACHVLDSGEWGRFEAPRASVPEARP